MSNFSKIDEQVSAALTTQAPTDKKGEDNGTPAIPPVEPTVTNAELGELERLRSENSELRQKQLETERDARIKVAIASTHVQATGPTTGEQAVRRQRAIAACRNKQAQWNKIPISERVNILTDGGYVPVTEKELSKYFAPGAKSTDVTQLMASDPRRYRSYRATAIELNWIG